jgi:membrane protein implicated in regulation of membrane protease activity
MPGVVWIWLAAALIFLITELSTPTLVFACFFAASVVSGVVALFAPDAYYWQIGVFAVIAVALLPATRPLARKLTKPAPQKSNVDGLIGKIALVTKAIDPDHGGQVKVGGEVWIAEASAPVAEGERVKISSASGAKLYVEKTEEKG